MAQTPLTGFRYLRRRKAESHLYRWVGKDGKKLPKSAA
jgi:hypothetical protein